MMLVSVPFWFSRGKKEDIRLPKVFFDASSISKSMTGRRHAFEEEKHRKVAPWDDSNSSFEDER